MVEILNRKESVWFNLIVTSFSAHSLVHSVPDHLFMATFIDDQRQYFHVCS